MQKKKTDELPLKWELHIRQFLREKNNNKKTLLCLPSNVIQKSSLNMSDPEYI